MTEWLLRLCEKSGTWRIDGPREWTLELIQHLKEVSNSISHVVDFWIDSILRGYTTKFAIYYTNSYSAAEREFFRRAERKVSKIADNVDQDGFT